MKLLLDTQVFIWFLSGEPQLSSLHRQAIIDPANEIFLSVASVWESVIKFQIGKLSLQQAPELFLPAEREKHNISSLSIDEQTVNALARLPALHRDPFDRIILAQAIQHQLILVTADSQMLAYPAAFLPS